MEIQEETVRNVPAAKATTVTRTSEKIPTQAEVADVKAFKWSQVVWYVIGLIEVLLTLRIIFLLLSAGVTTFTSLLYNLTDPLVAPFHGIFPVPSVSGSYFDTAAIVAMIVYALIGWGISGLINLNRRPVAAS